MNYVDGVLEPGENVRCRTNVSRTIYTPSILLAVCAAAVLIVGSNHRETEEFFWHCHGQTLAEFELWRVIFPNDQNQLRGYRFPPEIIQRRSGSMSGSP